MTHKIVWFDNQECIVEHFSGEETATKRAAILLDAGVRRLCLAFELY